MPNTRFNRRRISLPARGPAQMQLVAAKDRVDVKEVEAIEDGVVGGPEEHFGPMNHFELLNHPDVYYQMRHWLMRPHASEGRQQGG